jgi:hypothetical protein
VSDRHTFCPGRRQVLEPWQCGEEFTQPDGVTEGDRGQIHDQHRCVGKIPHPVQVLAQDRHGAEVELSADADDDRALPRVG